MAGPERKPRLSVIVPAYNAGPGLDSCLAALSRQTYPRDSFETIVIDNGSTESPERVVGRYRNARLACEPRPGSYAARNKGLALAEGEILAFTDADCVPAADWLEAGVSELCRLEADVAGGPIDTRPAGPTPKAIELYEMLFGYRRLEGDAPHCFTGNMFARRAVFDDVGPFLDSLKSGGDLEWSRRAQALGFRVVYSDLPRVSTPARSSWASLVARYRRLRGGFRDLDRLAAGEAPWVAASRSSGHSLIGDLRTLFGSKDAAPLTKVTAVAVAVAVRAVMAAEGARLRAGGDPRR